MKSIRLKEKQKKLQEQIFALNKGEVPAGVRPFVNTLKISELDTAAPASLLTVHFEMPQGTTLREVKEKLHYHMLGFSKAIDVVATQLQIASIKGHISQEEFLNRACIPVQSQDSALNELMSDLDLGEFGSSDKLLSLSKAKGAELYVSVMRQIADLRAAAAKRQSAAKETFEKKVEAIKNTEPRDLLKHHIREGIQQVLKEGKGSKKAVDKKDGKTTEVNGSVDYADAYSKAIQGMDDFKGSVTYVPPPPGLDFHEPVRKNLDKAKGNGKTNDSAKSKGKKGKSKKKDSNNNSSSSTNNNKGAEAVVSKGLGKKGKGKKQGGKGRGNGDKTKNKK